MNEKLSTEFRKIVGRVQVARTRFRTLINDRTWVDEARKYADRSRTEVQRLLQGDAAKLKVFLENERKELERFQRQIPTEVKKFRRLLDGRKRELEKLVRNIKRGKFAKSAKASKAPKAAKSTAKRARRKSSQTSASPASS